MKIQSKYQCTCCGGHIDPETMQCKYCGVQYEIENDWLRPIRIETFQMPIRTFKTQQIIAEEQARYLGMEKASQIAIESMARQLADAIAPMMKIEMNYNHFMQTREITGTVKVVEPYKWEE